jgi:hypothetical protein
MITLVPAPDGPRHPQWKWWDVEGDPPLVHRWHVTRVVVGPTGWAALAPEGARTVVLDSSLVTGYAPALAVLVGRSVTVPRRAPVPRPPLRRHVTPAA